MHAYKEDTPLHTIFRIRAILEKLNLLPIEVQWFNPEPGLFSVRIENTIETGHFGSNGKGRDCYFALASAYAEFIERIQNGFIVGSNGLSRKFLNIIKSQHGFFYYPDEVILSKEQFNNLPDKYLKDVFGDISYEQRLLLTEKYFARLEQNGLSGVVAVPFWDYGNKKIVHLPYNLTFILTGSNGMSAGNSIPEGVFQAICELIERFAARTVFFDQLTPATIPDNFLQNFVEEWSIITELKKKGYKVIIKDFSCGIGLPAIGILLIDLASNKYRLNIGADTSFKVALSRALTEVFQGVADDGSMKALMLEIPKQTPQYFLIDTVDSTKEKEDEIRKFIVNGTGVFPPSLFSEEESYSFSPSTFQTKESYKEEVSFLISKLSSLGFDIYLRNVSFLGFPSFYVYIPEISKWGRKSSQSIPTMEMLVKSIEHDKIEDVFFPFKSLLTDENRLQKLLNVLAPNREILYKGYTLDKVLNLEVDNSCELSRMPVNFFISLLCIALKEYGNASRFLLTFMNETSLENNEYYIEINKILVSLEKGTPEEELYSHFSKQILNDLLDNKKLFSYIYLPNCPYCTSCLIAQHCLTKSNFQNAFAIAGLMKMSEDVKQETFNTSF